MKSIKKLLYILLPPSQWGVVVLILLGILVGLGVYIYRISNAAAYLSSDPQACINCHVMVPEYATWIRSSHAHVASCVDCHVPHDNVFRKYKFKMSDGLRHATIFTLHKEPQVIRIKEEGAGVVQENCIRCHEKILDEVSLDKGNYEGYVHKESKLCWQCHRDVPHGQQRSLSATPFAFTPESGEVVPEWLKGFTIFIDKNNK